MTVNDSVVSQTTACPRLVPGCWPCGAERCGSQNKVSKTKKSQREDKLSPVVGYPGGKRRLLTSLRPYFQIDDISTYVEPFVGMGAVYLDIRQRGYKGLSVLADSNETVAEYWRAVHCPVKSVAVVNSAEELRLWPATEVGFWDMMAAPAPEQPERIARFLWLTNFMYANLPPAYAGGKWIATRSSGTKLKSAAKWNKTFPWGPCVARLRAVVDCLSGLPCTVVSDGVTLLASLTGSETVFADPPYLNQAKYSGSGRVSLTDYMQPIFAAKGSIVLTEMTEIAPPSGWITERVSVLSRQAGPGNGAGGQRKEVIYSRMMATTKDAA